MKIQKVFFTKKLKLTLGLILTFNLFQLQSENSKAHSNTQDIQKNSPPALKLKPSKNSSSFHISPNEFFDPHLRILENFLKNPYEVSNLETEDPCEVILKLSEDMNSHTRNVPMETLFGLVALGAGRSADFLKYIIENKEKFNSNFIDQVQEVEEKLKDTMSLVSHIKSILSDLRKFRKDFTEKDRSPNYKRKLIAQLTEQVLLAKNLENELEKSKKILGIGKESVRKYQRFFWPIKSIQIALGFIVLGYEGFLCEENSVSCISDQIIESISPIPITDMGDGTLSARYDNLPILILLDAERKIISKDEACRIVKGNKKILSDLKLVKALYESAKTDSINP